MSGEADEGRGKSAVYVQFSSSDWMFVVRSDIVLSMSEIVESLMCFAIFFLNFSQLVFFLAVGGLHVAETTLMDMTCRSWSDNKSFWLTRV